MTDELIARYLAGECNDGEKRQVEEWSRQHPDAMNEFMRIWQQVPSGEFTPDVEQALRKVHHRMDSRKRNHTRRILMWVSSAAAVVLLLSIIGIRSWNTSGGDRGPAGALSLLLQTDAGETLEHVLSDGSKVRLNRLSSIHYPEAFEGDVREIYLEGEAFFEIVPDADKPFIIRANRTVTRVVGTSFGVRAVKGEDEVVVTVSTGIINLSAEGKADRIEVKQGEQGVCNPEQHKLERNTNPDPNALAWKTKLLVFRQTPLTQVARAIENVYRTKILVDSSVSDIRLTSTFDRLSLEEVMQIIEMTLQIQAKADGKGGWIMAND
jgi:ferric-dicitrate binding protein FerR (iron transport regulator)